MRVHPRSTGDHVKAYGVPHHVVRIDTLYRPLYAPLYAPFMHACVKLHPQGIRFKRAMHLYQ